MQNKRKSEYKRRRRRNALIQLGLVLTIFVAIIGTGIYFVAGFFKDKEPSAPAFGQQDSEIPPENTVSADDKQPLAGITICLDAGHGYSDPGTVSPSAMPYEITESHVSLAISLSLKEKLEGLGASVVMTRAEDYTTKEDFQVWKKLSLEERRDIANNANADFTLSIHCDALENDDTVSGGTTYYFNSASRDQKVVETSKALAEAIAKGAADVSKQKTKVIEQKPGYSFLMVREIKGPAVLYELGFVTNSSDVKLLNSEEWRGKIVDALSTTISSYFKDISAA